MILDGKALARRVGAGLKEKTAAWTERNGLRPCLATVLVGDDPASAVYIGSKRRACARIGYESRHHELPASTPAAEVLALVQALNADAGVHGILVQLPLPPHIDPDPVIAAIDPRKDVDGFHPVSVGSLALKKPGFVSCTPLGIMRLIEETGIEVRGKRATIVGRSAIVGLPVALLLMHAHATIRVVHSRTPRADQEQAIREAEILVAAVGRPEFVPGEWVRPGSVVIDVGINRLPPETEGGKGRLVGDVEFEPAAERAGWITPVPGGVGPMTISMLMSNTLRAAEISTMRP